MTTCHVPGEGGIHVAVGEHHGTSLERRDDLVLSAIGEVGGVNQTEGHWSQQLFFLATTRHSLDQRRGVPFAARCRVTFGIQPTMQQRELRAFTRAIDAFDNEEPAGKAVFAGYLGFSCYHLVPGSPRGLRLARFLNKFFIASPFISSPDVPPGSAFDRSASDLLTDHLMFGRGGIQTCDSSRVESDPGQCAQAVRKDAEQDRRHDREANHRLAR